MNWLLEYFLGEYFFLNRKMSIFAPKRKNRQIFLGAISLIYWPILTNLGIKLIVSTRQIQWNNLQSNILKNKDFQFFVSFAHKNQFSHNFPSYLSAEKIRKNLFWSFCTDSCLKWSDIEKKVPNHSALLYNHYRENINFKLIEQRIWVDSI